MSEFKVRALVTCVAIIAAAVTIICTSQVFAEDVWHVMLMMMVVVPSLAALGVVIVVAGVRRNPSWVSRPFRLRGRSTRPLPDDHRPAVERRRMVPGEVLERRPAPRELRR